MFRWILALFILLPLLEVWGLIAVGHWIGGWQTLLLVIAIAFLGAYFAKKEVSRVWREASYQFRNGQMPANSLLDGLCILIGGLLLLFPGFLTDIFGLVFLLPFTRPLAKTVILFFLQKLITKGRFRIYRR